MGKLVKHTYINVNEDDMKNESFDGELVDFATQKLNETIPELSHVINIESSGGVSEIRPVMCNSRTWYKCRWMQLSVWYY